MAGSLLFSIFDEVKNEVFDEVFVKEEEEEEEEEIIIIGAQGCNICLKSAIFYSSVLEMISL